MTFQPQKIRWIILLLIIIGPCLEGLGYAQWQRIDFPSAHYSPSAIEASEGVLFTASRNQVYMSSADKDWQPLFHLPSNQNVLRIRSHHKNLWVLTEESLIRFDLESKEKVFLIQRHDEDSRSFLDFEIGSNPNHLFLGTSRGLEISKDGGSTWQTASFFKNSSAVTKLLFKAGSLFAVTDGMLYLISNQNNPKLLFSIPQHLDEDSEIFFDGLMAYSSFFDVISGQNRHEIFISSTAGIFQSKDFGSTWNKISHSGIKDSAVLNLVYDEQTNQLYGATLRSVYAYDFKTSRWSELYKGLEGQRVFQISAFNHEIVAATETGLLEITPEAEEIKAPAQYTEEKFALFKRLTELEPKIQTIQKHVIAYGDASPKKIKRWHVASRLAALMPNLSFGKDFSESNNIDLDRGSSSVADVYIEGPSDIDEDWSLDLSWDLGDFFYSTAQTSIDSRSKLTADLRRDLLAEATRLYYERRRLQAEIVFTPPPTDLEFLEKIFRLEEVTALLDGLCGGFLKKSLSVIYEQNLELKEIWERTPQLAAGVPEANHH